MKNEPNIEQIVLNPSRTPYNSQLMENLKFSQMTFPIFPHFANDFEQAWEILSHRSTLTEHKNFPKASFLVIYFWIAVRSVNCICFQDFLQSYQNKIHRKILFTTQVMHREHKNKSSTHHP